MKQTLFALFIPVLTLCPMLLSGQMAVTATTERTEAPEVGSELWVDRHSLGGPCSDSRPRAQVTYETPWCTLLPAVNQVQPGDTVRVRAGVYTETLEGCHSCNTDVVLQIVTSGAPGAWIRFIAMAGETVEIAAEGGGRNGVWVRETWDGIVPRYVEIRGFKIRDFPGECVVVANTSNVVLGDLEVTNCTGQSVGFGNSSYVVLEGSTVHHNSLSGWSSAVTLHQCGSGHVIRGNAIWANTDEHPDETEGHGLIMDTCGESGGALIENNLIWDNEGWCLAIFRSNGARFRNNTCWMNGNGRWGTGEVIVLGEDHSFHNNIIIPRNGAAFNFREKTGEYVGHLHTISADGNLIWSPFSGPYGDRLVRWSFGIKATVEQYRLYNPYGWGTTALGVDPQLVDGFGQDFRLAAGSPALDSGDPSHAAAVDILGTPRPQDGDGDGQAVPDRGAFEFENDVGLFFLDGFEGGDTSNWSQTID